ncbi:MAG: glycosyltransferase family 2 protein [Saprospiraceae bacterium]|nr:glycosyltransferase family 2 protein [Saprospiraceae bacterium]MBK9631300.1 glycosyltransferase family 2 protein [Saprospiraceae bacterium]
MIEKLTILIPTRDREEYLIWCIKSCLNSSYHPLEVLICDNSSTSLTHDTFLSFSDPRLKYIKAPTFLSMVANWEFAISQVEEGFISILGDDDAFLPEGVVKAMGHLKKNSLKSISWRQASYRWPGNEFAKIPELYELPISSGNSIRKPKDFINSVLQARLHPNNLPCIYHGIVHIDLIRKVKEIGNGQFFNSRIPDYYAIMILSCVVDDYIYSYEPLTIAGSSPKSNGNAQVMLDKKFENVKNEFAKGQEDIEFHSRLKFVHVYSILIWEAFLQAKSQGCNQFSDLVNPKMQIRNAIKEAAAFNLLNEEFEKIQQIAMKFQLLQSDRPSIFRSFLYKWQYHLKHYFYFWTNSVFIDCRRLKIDNIFDLSNLHFKLLRTYGNKIYFLFHNGFLLTRYFFKKYLSFKL